VKYRSRRRFTTSATLWCSVVVSQTKRGTRPDSPNGRDARCAASLSFSRATFFGGRARLPIPFVALTRFGDGLRLGSAKARIFKQDLARVIVLTAERGFKKCAARLRGIATVKHFGKTTVNFARAFRWLRDDLSVKRLLCEGGGNTNAALVEAGVVDQIHITICPLVLRGQSAPTLFDVIGAASLQSATGLRLKKVKVIDGELFLTYVVLMK
jgi:riboflavin biosynthesis pyrimidine reductase